MMLFGCNSHQPRRPNIESATVGTANGPMVMSGFSNVEDNVDPIYGTQRSFNAGDDYEVKVHYPPYNPDPAKADCAAPPRRVF